ncbi:hypothetical protein PPS11_31076 [Pseudomonas putida S11]|nr:hypothetical protein PPS11_31076 [Pseudomonas putida S11]
MSEHETAGEGRFNSIEIRILGSLIEKQATSPESYPLTLNALVLACNQKTSREPVMNLTQGQVGQALRALEGQDMTRLQMGSRADRWEQRVDKALELVPAQLVLMGLMFLRGPQTRQRTADPQQPPARLRRHRADPAPAGPPDLARPGLAPAASGRPARRPLHPCLWATRPKSRQSWLPGNKKVGHAAAAAMCRKNASKPSKRASRRWKHAWPNWKAEPSRLGVGEVAAALALGQLPVTGALVDEHGAAVGVDFQVAPVQVLLLLPGLWGGLATRVRG